MLSQPLTQDAVAVLATRVAENGDYKNGDYSRQCGRGLVKTTVMHSKPFLLTIESECDVQDSMTQMLSFDDPRHGPAPPQRRVRKAVYPSEAFMRQPEIVLSPITHEKQSAITASRVTGPCDSHWTPVQTQCRRRNLSVWDTVNTITGETLPYSVSEDMTQHRDAWVDGKIQNSVAPPPPPQINEDDKNFRVSLL